MDPNHYDVTDHFHKPAPGARIGLGRKDPAVGGSGVNPEPAEPDGFASPSARQRGAGGSRPDDRAGRRAPTYSRKTSKRLGP